MPTPCAGPRKIDLVLCRCRGHRTDGSKRDEEIVNFINSMTHGLPVEFEALVNGDSYLPDVGGNDEVATAPPMPDETETAEDRQPEEEDETSDPNHEIHTRAREQLIANLEDLADGTVRIGDRVLTFCVACGDPRHTWRNAISTPPELKEI